ncbi:Sodium/hydrogen exchanger [Gloeophyllum trabeum ATCC 11539]|uniref:Sodium/hydrogen exchanger n=1 Tax=Gloeophyllum trabeum (strain ATCC 11539 / FP-39264 / Madison 617) TaxID=670483 RepID=S7RED6_GLOTA|nr:Sodium/hydrogen exchanger [Gloeophyllum trabeum ATCC 11539]EPQ50839.1 Sodium/hydrogen exchanger [Gloeophyllum trabeum ATCC 11539]
MHNEESTAGKHQCTDTRNRSQSKCTLLGADGGHGSESQGRGRGIHCILSGSDPSNYDYNDPFKLWAIQGALIIVISRICFLLLWRMRQPRVVAEIIGGIVLGPTVMGRIPKFSTTIFPQESIPILNLCATLGLVLFLFLAGLEIDLQLIKQHARTSAVVSAAGSIIPFAFGSLLSLAHYRAFMDDSVNFGHFALFTCISVGITAFPILCRMLAQLELFSAPLGVIVLSAGVGNDVVGWILLALAVTLVNSTTGLAALWILLICIGYTLFLIYPVRWLFRWIGQATGELGTGEPSSIMMACAIMMLLVSAFFTDITGLHAIFGAFISGLIIPRDKQLSIAMMKRLEPVVWNIFLPVYFALSGLKTDLGLLNTGKAWGFTILVCLLAYMGKLIGCGGASKLMGFTWRESAAIGTLMSCKWLLELIVINFALQAKVFPSIVFAMFVVHAVVLMVIITPVTGWIYPARCRSQQSDTPVCGASDTSISGV